MLQTTTISRLKQLGNYQNFMTLLIIIICLLFYGWLTFKGEHNLLTPTGLQQAMQELGWWAPLIYMGILALSVIISPIPGAPLVVAGGVIWELPLAGIYSVMGGFLGGLVAYWIGRTLGDTAIQSITGRSLQLISEQQKSYAGWFVLIMRLFPVLPFGLISYTSGLAKLPATSYALATLIGMTPPTFLLSYWGQSLTTDIFTTIIATLLVLIGLIGLPLLAHQWNWLGVKEAKNNIGDKLVDEALVGNFVGLKSLANNQDQDGDSRG